MPQNWKTYKLEEVLQIKNGKTKPKETGNIPIYGGNGILGFGDKFNLDSEVILIGRVGAYCGAVYYENRKIWVSDNSLYGISKNGFDSKYLFYLLKWTDLNRFATGSSQPLLTQGALNVLEFQIPSSLQEQKAIASILSALDDKIELNLQMNKTLEEMAMALYKHWFVDFGPFKEGEFIDSELGKIPKGWEVKELGELIDLNPRLSIKKGVETSFVEMKVLPTDAMSVSDIAKKEFKGGSKFQNGDTLFARITPCLENGKTAFVDFLENDEIAFGSTEFLVMRAKIHVSKYWVYCLSRYEKFRTFSISTMVGTSGRQRVQNDPFLKYKVIKSTKEVYSNYSEEVEPWFHQIRINTLENQTLTQLRDTLLSQLISGKIRVKEVEQQLKEVL